jgi:hypothetical protein
MSAASSGAGNAILLGWLLCEGLEEATLRIKAMGKPNDVQ